MDPNIALFWKSNAVVPVSAQESNKKTPILNEAQGAGFTRNGRSSFCFGFLKHCWGSTSWNAGCNRFCFTLMSDKS